MPKFIYTAKSYGGETKGGEMVAKNEKSLVEQLRGDGFLVTSIKEIESGEEKAKTSFMDRFKKVPLKEKMVFARNLSVMIASGLTISRAIQNISIQTENKTFQNILTDIYEELQGGKTLSDGLAKYPSVFSELFVNMVKVGEVGGNLDEVLKIVAVQLEKEHELLSKVRGALIYPSVIVVAMILIGIIMLTYVLPNIIGVFEDMEVTLPASTQFIVNVSNFMGSHSILVILIFVFFIFMAKFFLSTESGKKTISYLVIKLPIIKGIVIKVNCARFSRIYSSLLKSGISAVDALKIISNTLSNYYYKQAIRGGVESIQKGVNLSKILSGSDKLFPALVYQIVEVGEETGKTEDVLLQLAEFYEEEVNQITKNLSSIIEPILMLVIGGAVGFFAVSMLQPMYSLLENIK